MPFVGLILNQLASVYHALLQTKTKSVNIREKMKSLISMIVVFRPNYLVTRLSSSSMEVFTVI